MTQHSEIHISIKTAEPLDLQVFSSMILIIRVLTLLRLKQFLTVMFNEIDATHRILVSVFAGISSEKRYGPHDLVLGDLRRYDALLI